MNNGLFGFPLGPNATFKETILLSSATFTPQPNAKYIIVESQGAGAGGAGGNTTTSGSGGSCGQYLCVMISAEEMRPSCNITIGATSATRNSITNNQTGQLLITVGSGRSGEFPPTVLGTVVQNAFGAGSPAVTTAANGAPGKHGGFGAGGGGAGGGLSGGVAYAGGDGGKPCSFQMDTTNNVAATGGGPLGGTTSGANGASGVVIVRGLFGEGGAGGAGSTTGAGGNGGNGLYGGGGGGGGRCTSGTSTGGLGGTGVMRLLEVCYP